MNPEDVGSSLAPVEYEVQKKKEAQKYLEISNQILRTVLPAVNGVELED